MLLPHKIVHRAYVMLIETTEIGLIMPFGSASKSHLSRQSFHEIVQRESCAEAFCRHLGEFEHGCGNTKNHACGYRASGYCCTHFSIVQASRTVVLVCSTKAR